LNLWDHYAKCYNVLRSNPVSFLLYKFERKAVLDLLSRRTHTQKNGKALDLATGRGWSLDLIPKDISNVYALDQSAEMVRLVQVKYPHAEAIQCDALSTPYASGSMDIILCVGLSEYISDLQMLLAEIIRLLSNDGCAIITSSPPNLLNQLRKFMGHQIYLRSVSTIEEMFDNQGFFIIKKNHSTIQDQYLITKQ
jgi:ubiquinone/menaquinone biosynthesis C-methylase UbiE